MVAVNDAQITIPPMPLVEQLVFRDSLVISSYWCLLSNESEYTIYICFSIHIDVAGTTLAKWKNSLFSDLLEK